MLVRQLIGRNAGEIIDLPYAVATACLAVGTACPPDVDPPRIRGATSALQPRTLANGEALTEGALPPDSQAEAGDPIDPPAATGAYATRRGGQGKYLVVDPAGADVSEPMAKADAEAEAALRNIRG